MKKIFLGLILLILLGCSDGLGGIETVILQNDYLRVVAKQKGAELTSIKLLEDGTEYLWQGDSITWGDHAIVQFPIIGNLKNGTYTYHGQTYEMMSHGFARLSAFQIVELSKESVLFELRSNKSTMEMYPFDFALQVGYHLQGKSINVSFEVLNKGEKDIFFSLGYHPGFNCPFIPDERMSDYYLEFPKEESANRLVMRDNLIDSIQDHYLTNTHILKLGKQIFQEDAIILKEVRSTSIALKNTQNSKSVIVDFGHTPYLGIWSPKKHGDFVCIEPWLGIPDKTHASGHLHQKDGMILLPDKESFNWSCKLTIN